MQSLPLFHVMLQTANWAATRIHLVNGSQSPKKLGASSPYTISGTISHDGTSHEHPSRDNRPCRKETHTKSNHFTPELSAISKNCSLTMKIVTSLLVELNGKIMIKIQCSCMRLLYYAHILIKTPCSASVILLLRSHRVSPPLAVLRVFVLDDGWSEVLT